MVEYNKWLNIDDICTTPQEIGTTENYCLKGEVASSKEKPADDYIGFFVNGRISFTKPDNGETMWVKFKE